MWRQSADWLFTQRNLIYNSDTIVVLDKGFYANSGWNDYYITQQGRRDSINVIGQYELELDDLDQYDHVFVVEMHYSHLRGDLQNKLTESFELTNEAQDYPIKLYERK